MDKRRITLKTSLSILSNEQLWQILNTPKDQMVYDGANYSDGKFCPLAVGLGLTSAVDDADCVRQIQSFGIKNPRNMHGVPGDFYRQDRHKDLITVVQELLSERQESL